MGNAAQSMASYAQGGVVRGKGTTTSDSVPVRLSKKEFVLPADTVDAIGVKTLNALVAATHKHVKPEGKARTRRMANGGLVEDDENKPALPGTDTAGAAVPATTPPADTSPGYGQQMANIGNAAVSGVARLAKEIVSAPPDAASPQGYGVLNRLTAPSPSPAPVVAPEAPPASAVSTLTRQPAYAVNPNFAASVPTAAAAPVAGPADAQQGTPWSITKTPSGGSGGAAIKLSGVRPAPAPPTEAEKVQAAIEAGLQQQLRYSQAALDSARSAAWQDSGGNPSLFAHLMGNYAHFAGQNNFGSVQQAGATGAGTNAVERLRAGTEAAKAGPVIEAGNLGNADTRAIQKLQTQYENEDDEDKRFDIADKIAIRSKAGRQARATAVPLGVDDMGRNLGSAVLNNRTNRLTYPREELGVGNQAQPLPASKDKLVQGQLYQTARGAAKWDGKQFVAQ